MQINNTWVLPITEGIVKKSTDVNLTAYPYAGKKVRHIGLTNDNYILPFQPYNRVLCTDNDVLNACMENYSSTGNVYYPPACEYFAYPTSIERMCISNANKSMIDIFFGTDKTNLTTIIESGNWGKNVSEAETWSPIEPFINVYYTQNVRYTGIRPALALATGAVNNSVAPFNSDLSYTSFLCDEKAIIILNNTNQNSCINACRLTPDCSVVTYGLSYEKLSNLFGTEDNIYTGNTIKFYEGRYDGLTNVESGMACALYQDCVSKRPYETNNNTVKSILSPTYFDTTSVVYNYVCVEDPILEIITAKGERGDPPVPYSSTFASGFRVNGASQWIPESIFIESSGIKTFDYDEGVNPVPDFVNSLYKDAVYPSTTTVYAGYLTDKETCDNACKLIPNCVVSIFTSIENGPNLIKKCQFYDECAPARMVPFHNATTNIPALIQELSSELSDALLNVTTKANCGPSGCDTDPLKYTCIASMIQTPIVPKYDMYPFSSKQIGVDYKYNVLSVDRDDPIDPFYTAMMIADLGGAFYNAIRDSMPELYSGIYTSADAMRSESGVFDNSQSTCTSLIDKGDSVMLITPPVNDDQVDQFFNVTFWCDVACKESCSNQNYTSGYWGVYNDINRTCSADNIAACLTRCSQSALIGDIKAASPDIFNDITWIQTDVEQWEKYCVSRIHSETRDDTHRWTYTKQLHTPLHSNFVFSYTGEFKNITPATLAAQHFVTLPDSSGVEELLTQSMWSPRDSILPVNKKLWYTSNNITFNPAIITIETYALNNTASGQEPDLTQLGSMASVTTRIMRGYVPIIDCGVTSDSYNGAFTFLFNCYTDIKVASDIESTIVNVSEWGRCYDVFSTNASISDISTLIEHAFNPIYVSGGDVYTLSAYEESVSGGRTPVEYAQLGPDAKPVTAEFSSNLFRLVSDDNSDSFTDSPDYISYAKDEQLFIHCEKHKIAEPNVWIEREDNNVNTTNYKTENSDITEIFCDGTLDLPARYIKYADVYPYGTKLYRLAFVTLRAYRTNKDQLKVDTKYSWGAPIGVRFYSYINDPVSKYGFVELGVSDPNNPYASTANFSNMTLNKYYLEFPPPSIQSEFATFPMPYDMFLVNSETYGFDFTLNNQPIEFFCGIGETGDISSLDPCWGVWITGMNYDTAGNTTCANPNAKFYDYLNVASCVQFETCVVDVPQKSFCSFSYAPPTFNSSTSYDYYEHAGIIGYSSHTSVRSPSVFRVQGGNEWLPGRYHRMPNTFYRSSPTNYAWGTGGSKDMPTTCKPKGKNYYYLMPTGKPVFYPTIMKKPYWFPVNSANTPYVRPPNNVTHVMVASRQSPLEITFIGNNYLNKDLINFYNITQNGTSYFMQPFYEDQTNYFSFFEKYTMSIPVPYYSWENVQSERMENPYTSPLLLKTLKSKCASKSTSTQCEADISCMWQDNFCRYAEGTRCWELNDFLNMTANEKKTRCQSGPCVWLRVSSDGISGTPLNQEGTMYFDKANSTDDYKCIPITHKTQVVLNTSTGYGGKSIVDYTRLVNTDDSMFYENTSGYEKGIYTTRDDISYYPCPQTLAGVFPGTCLKPSVHIFAGFNGSVVIPTPATGIFDPDPFPLYDQCPVYDAGAETFVDGRTFVFSDAVAAASPFSKTYANPLQSALHYCQEFESPEGLRAFPYCDDDPLTPVEKSRLCVNKGGDQLLAGTRFSSALVYTDICYTNTDDKIVTCFYIPGNQVIGSITDLISTFKQVTKNFAEYKLDIYIVPIYIEQLVHIIFNPVVYNVALSVVIAENSIVADGNAVTKGQNVAQLQPPFFSKFGQSATVVLENVLQFYKNLSDVISSWDTDPDISSNKYVLSAVTNDYITIPPVIIEESNILIDTGQISIRSLNTDLIRFQPLISPIFTVLSGNFVFDTHSIDSQYEDLVIVTFVGSDTGESIVSNIYLKSSTPCIPVTCIGRASYFNPNIPEIPYVDVTGLMIENIVYDFPPENIKHIRIARTLASFSRTEGVAAIYHGPKPVYSTRSDVVIFKNNGGKYISWKFNRLMTYQHSILTLVGPTVQWTGIPIALEDDMTWSIRSGSAIQWNNIELSNPSGYIFATPKGAPYACLDRFGTNRFVLCDTLYGNDNMDPSSPFTVLLPQRGDCKNVSGAQIFVCAGELYQSEILEFYSYVNCSTTSPSIHISDLPQALGVSAVFPFIPGAYFSCVNGKFPVMIQRGYGAIGYADNYITITVEDVTYYGSDTSFDGEGVQLLNMSQKLDQKNYETASSSITKPPSIIANVITAIIYFMCFSIAIIVLVLDDRINKIIMDIVDIKNEEA